MKNFNLTLGVSEALKIHPFEVVSQDKNTNKLNITLVNDKRGQFYDLTGTTVILYFKREDEERFQQYATITRPREGQIEIILDTDIIEKRGNVFAEVAIYTGEETKCTSQLFAFRVRKNINDGEVVVSGNDLPNYRQEMQRLETILDNLILSAGDSHPEVVAARYSMLENETFATIGNRLDYIEEKARQNVVNLETSITTVADDLVAHKAGMVQQSPHGIGSIAGQIYEEGVFTPKIEGLTVAGSHTYYNQIGRYVRIGNRVFLYIDAYINSFDTSMEGQVVISGLPYLIPSGKAENVAVDSYRNIKFAQGYHQLACEITSLSTRLTLIQHGINNNRYSVVAGDLSSASWIRVQFSYSL